MLFLKDQFCVDNILQFLYTSSYLTNIFVWVDTMAGTKDHSSGQKPKGSSWRRTADYVYAFFFILHIVIMFSTSCFIPRSMENFFYILWQGNEEFGLAMY